MTATGRLDTSCCGHGSAGGCSAEEGSIRFVIRYRTLVIWALLPGHGNARDTFDDGENG